MADDPEIPSERAEARLSAKALKAKRLERLEAYLDLLASGYSCEQIAQAMKVSVSSVRRAIDRALDSRPLMAPERYARVQVQRLTKALRAADYWLDQGELQAIAPMVKVVAELDRYHGLAARYRRIRPAAAPPALARDRPPSLALPRPAAPALDFSPTAVAEEPPLMAASPASE